MTDRPAQERAPAKRPLTQTGPRSARARALAGLCLLALLALVLGFVPAPVGEAQASAARDVRFAVIGDFGAATVAEGLVADRVKSWQPDFIITTGDNNYVVGGADTIDRNIGFYYQSFIAP